MSISKYLNIDIDINAAKLNQVNVISHDKNIYVNKNSIKWNSIKKVSNNKKKEKDIIVNERDFFNGKVRFDNLQEIAEKIDFQDKKAIYIPKGVGISKVKVFGKINKGKRNTVLSAVAYQIRALNPSIDWGTLSKLIFEINKKFCVPRYPAKELRRLINSISEIPEDDLKPRINETRKIIYNPKYRLSKKEKRSLNAKLTGSFKRKLNTEKIKCRIENWDFKKNNKITQKRLAKETGLSLGTIKRYYPKFKAKIKEINEKFKYEPP